MASLSINKLHIHPIQSRTSAPSAAIDAYRNRTAEGMKNPRQKQHPGGSEEDFKAAAEGMNRW